MAKVSAVSAVIPQVQKVQEFTTFMDLVKRGLWKNTSYIAELCFVDRDTIAEWKKRPEVIAAHVERSKKELDKWDRIGKVEDRLKEQGMEFDPDRVEAKVEIIVKGLENL